MFYFYLWIALGFIAFIVVSIIEIYESRKKGIDVVIDISEILFCGIFILFGPLAFMFSLVEIISKIIDVFTIKGKKK